MIRLEEEKEMRRAEEYAAKQRAELEEEERKKRAKEENVKLVAEEAMQRLADEKKSKNKSRKFPRSNTEDSTMLGFGDRANSNFDAPPQPRSPPADFRSSSPPVPAAAKKLNGGKPPIKPSVRQSNANVRQSIANVNFNAPADYYTTESRLNLASPVRNLHILYF